MKKTLIVELTHDNPDSNSYFYVTMGLPAEEHEIRDACQRARITGKEEMYLYVSVLESSVLPDLFDKRLDSPTIDELNFFAKRLAALGEEEQLVLCAIFPQIIKDGDGIISMKDLINCTYQLDNVMVMHGVSNDTELGEIVIESGMEHVIENISDDLVHLLDRAQIGKELRENEGGVFLDGNYIAAGEYELPEVYDGVHLPETKVDRWYTFRLKIEAPLKAGDSACQAEWITLPVGRKEADHIARRLGARRIEECVCLEFDSAVPQISKEQFDSMKEFDKLNCLAERISYMSSEDQVKFKAVLEAESPSDMDDVLAAVESLSKYEISIWVDDEASFFREYLIHYLDERFDRSWIDILSLYDEGKMLLEKLGAIVTEYGVISARGRSLYELVPYFDFEEFMNEDMQIESHDSESADKNTQSQTCSLQIGGM